MELPHLEQLYQRFQDQGLKMVAINVIPEQDEIVPRWLDEKGFTFPVLVGGSADEFIETYQLISTPLNFLLDDKGRIVRRWDGYYPGAELEIEKVVEQLFAN